MKNVWKLFAIVICAGSLLCACGQKETATGTIGSQQVAVTQPMERGDADSALAAICGAIQAKTPEELAPFVTGGNESLLRQLVEHYPKEDGDVTAEYAGSYNGYDMFAYKLAYNGVTFEEGMLMLQPQQDGYKLCLDAQIQQDMLDHCQCSACGGAGGNHAGGFVCGICGGTGQQYHANVYYDGNMWQGQFLACSGCGGSGQTGSNWISCAFCGGSGWRFD